MYPVLEEIHPLARRQVHNKFSNVNYRGLLRLAVKLLLPVTIKQMTYILQIFPTVLIKR